MTLTLMLWRRKGLHAQILDRACRIIVKSLPMSV
jgi:hypothetical protein